MQKKKLIVILGPTASGKTALSIKLAKKFSGEIISADSRQMYKGLDIGSGKITKREMKGIPHHLLSIANPKRKFTVVQFQKLALKKIKEIQKKNKIPFLVGGTGFYLQFIVDGIIIPEVKPNWKLRKKLAKKTTEELYQMLKKLAPARTKNIDSKNPRRLIRAIEIALSGQGQTSSEISSDARRIGRGLTLSETFDTLQLGIKKSFNELKKAIQKRLHQRLKIGMIAEVKKLHDNGLSWKRLEEFGLEYRFVAQHIQGKITYQAMQDKIQKESEYFSKRQMTWFKRNQRIKWIKNQREAEKLIKEFLQ